PVRPPFRGDQETANHRAPAPWSIAYVPPERVRLEDSGRDGLLTRTFWAPGRLALRLPKSPETSEVGGRRRGGGQVRPRLASGPAGLGRATSADTRTSPGRCPRPVRCASPYRTGACGGAAAVGPRGHARLRDVSASRVGNGWHCVTRLGKGEK